MRETMTRQELAQARDSERTLAAEAEANAVKWAGWDDAEMARGFAMQQGIHLDNAADYQARIVRLANPLPGGGTIR